MSAPILTRADVDRVLKALGSPPAIDGPTRCPHCGKDGALTISQNGGPEPRFACAQGCQEEVVRAVIRGAVQMHPSASESFDPLENVREALKMPGITRIAKHGRGAAYVLHCDDGSTIDLGTTADLFVRRRMEAAILATARHMIQAATAAKHRELVHNIELAAEQIDNILTSEEETLGLIGEFTNARRATRNVDLNDKHELYGVLEEGYPFYDLDGRLYVRLEDLTGWLNRMSGQRFTRQELSGRLARLDFTKPDDGGQIAARRGDKTRSRRLWISPPNFEARL